MTAHTDYILDHQSLILNELKNAYPRSLHCQDLRYHLFKKNPRISYSYCIQTLKKMGKIQTTGKCLNTEYKLVVEGIVDARVQELIDKVSHLEMKLNIIAAAFCTSGRNIESAFS